MKLALPEEYNNCPLTERNNINYWKYFSCLIVRLSQEHFRSFPLCNCFK